MDEVVVRPMALEDLEAIGEIERRCFASPWSEESFARELEGNPAARYLVVTVNGRVVGYAGTWFIVDEGHITNIAVDPDYRGRGLGELVTRTLMRTAAELGMRWMTLEVRRSNFVAQGLYRKLGFVDVGYRKRYYEDNQEDALVMVCEGLPAE